MSHFELVNRDGDTGMLVVGAQNLDAIFRRQADAGGHADERLIDLSIEEALDPEALRLAAAGHVAAEATIEVHEVHNAA